MVVIYESGSIDHVDEVEAHLTDHFCDADNFRRGGAGPAGEAPHYVYVVIDYG